MAKIQISTDSDLPADTVLAATTDFSSRRPTLWPNIDPSVYKAHEIGDDWADVTEGSEIAGGVWTRERYDWSVPGVVRATVQDSNIFKSGSGDEGETKRRGQPHRDPPGPPGPRGSRGSCWVA